MLSSLRSRLQLACRRTTLTRVHFSFVFAAFLHCVSLVLIQSISFSVNYEGRHLLIDVMEVAGARRDVLAVVATNPTALYSCQKLPSDGLTAGDFKAMTRMCTQLSPLLNDTTSQPANVGSNPLPEMDPYGSEDPDFDDAEDEEDEDGSDDDSDSDTDSDSDDDDSDDEETEDEEEAEESQTAFPTPRKVKRSLYRPEPRVAIAQRYARRLLYPNNVVILPGVEGSSRIGATVVGLNTEGGVRDSNGGLLISNACAAALRYPEQMLQDMEREDVSFLFFHIWLLIISVIAVTQESVPHIASSLAGQSLATVFSIWNIFRSLKFHSRFDQLVANEVCGGADLLPHYWQLRDIFNISVAVVNVVVLVVAAVLSHKLVKMWLGANFRSVGSSPKIRKLYSILMAFSALLRLYLFFVVLTAALWIDQIAGGLMHTFLRQAQFDGYLGMCTIALIFALPLVILGDSSMRTERRRLAAGFIVMLVFFLIFHVALLASSPIFRWTLIVWPFLAMNFGASFLLAVVVLVLAIVCRTNFGRGLDHFLHVNELLERDGFTPANAPVSPFILPAARRTTSGRFEAVLERGDTLRIQAALSMPPARTSQEGPVMDITASPPMRAHDSLAPPPSVLAITAASLSLGVPAAPMASRWSATTGEPQRTTRGSWDSSLARSPDSGFYSQSALDSQSGSDSQSSARTQQYDIREAKRVQRTYE